MSIPLEENVKYCHTATKTSNDARIITLKFIPSLQELNDILIWPKKGKSLIAVLLGIREKRRTSSANSRIRSRFYIVDLLLTTHGLHLVSPCGLLLSCNLYFGNTCSLCHWMLLLLCICPYVSQLIRYAWVCSLYECFILKARRLSSKLPKQGYLVERLKLSFKKFYGRCGDLIQQYDVSFSRMLSKREVPRGVRNSKVRRQDKFRKDWSQH